MSEALLADLRVLAEVFATQERAWRRRAADPYTEGIRDGFDVAETRVRDLIAKHEAESDVSERDELAQVDSIGTDKNTDDNWLKREFARANERSNQLPAFARPVDVRENRRSDPRRRVAQTMTTPTPQPRYGGAFVI